MRRSWPLLVLGLLICAVFLGFRSRETPNAKVINDVKQHYKSAPWMKHVTDWGTTLTISVKTDYPHDRIDSYAAAYEICAAVKSEYARNATDLPNLRIYGTDTTVKVKVDGSKEKETDKVAMAEATSLHDYTCGMTPPEELQKEAEDYAIPVFGG